MPIQNKLTIVHLKQKSLIVEFCEQQLKDYNIM